jgi:hypothetical protein
MIVTKNSSAAPQASIGASSNFADTYKYMRIAEGFLDCPVG